MAKTGRPQIEIDWGMVQKMLHIQCTGEEIASIVGCSYDTLERACKRDLNTRFADYSKKKRSEGKASLRRSQWLLATDKHNASMLIWLGKQMLGQRDQPEGEADAPHDKAREIRIAIRQIDDIEHGKTD